jgi:hypothetical protein
MTRMLQEHLKLVYEGKLRSLVVSLRVGCWYLGHARWSCSNADSASVVGELAVLTRGLIAGRE